MKVAILIHTHRDPALVSRLVSRVQHPQADIYINVDAKVDILPFEELITNASFLKNRVEVAWGRFSQVQQMLNSFEEIKNTGISYSHILFISGQDYPIRKIEDIVTFLSENKNRSFIDYHPLLNGDWDKVVRKRFEYWFFLPESDIRSKTFIKKVLTRLGYKRKFPLTPYYGSCWMCLNMEAAFYVLDFTAENPDYVKFNQHTGCADELYIQSILVNSPLKDSLENNNYRYIDWKGGNGKSPKVLTLADFSEIKQSNAWFARKVELGQSDSLLDELDRVL